MSLRDLVEGEAMLDDEENDADVPDDFDGEEGAPRRGNEFNDSSEEDEDEDDDEEARRAVRSKPAIRNCFSAR